MGGKEKMKSNLTTLCYIEKDGKYLMLHRIKKKKDINKDKWIGVGGHFEENESPEECLLREVKEETGFTLTRWKLRGIITFLCDCWQTEYMFLYTADGFTGEMITCEEGDLEWVEKEKVYELPIWEGDKVFFRLLEERDTFFSLKLRYEQDELVECVLDGEKEPVKFVESNKNKNIKLYKNKTKFFQASPKNSKFSFCRNREKKDCWEEIWIGKLGFSCRKTYTLVGLTQK